MSSASSTFVSGGSPTATQVNGWAQGVLSTASVTANQGTFTAETDLTSLAVTVTVVANRRIRITAGGGALASSVSGDELGFFIKESAAYIAKMGITCPAANRNVPTHLEADITPTAGSHTYKLSASRNSGTGAVTFVAAAANNAGPAFITVEDIGAV